jgi:hypothetical protein
LTTLTSHTLWESTGSALTSHPLWDSARTTLTSHTLREATWTTGTTGTATHSRAKSLLTHLFHKCPCLRLLTIIQHTIVIGVKVLQKHLPQALSALAATAALSHSA